MRSIAAAALSLFLLPIGTAEAQVKRADGAFAAGLCASAMEFVALSRAQAGLATPRELDRLQKTRDVLLSLPQFQKGEVEAYANALSQRMAENMRDATTDAKRAAITKEISGIARQCHRDMVAEIRALNDQGVVITSPPPLQSAPMTTQPLQPQTIPSQPLQTQPIIINPE